MQRFMETIPKNPPPLGVTSLVLCPRNPGAAPHIRFLLIFGLVLIETLVIYALLITIIILMVQWGKYV